MNEWKIEEVANLVSDKSDGQFKAISTWLKIYICEFSSGDSLSCLCVNEVI